MKHRAFLLIMNHSQGAGTGQGVPGAQSVACEGAGRFGPLIRALGFQKDLILSGCCGQKIAQL